MQKLILDFSNWKKEGKELLFEHKTTNLYHFTSIKGQSVEHDCRKAVVY